MKYSFPCQCGHVTTVDASDDAEAVTKIMDAGKIHMAEVHPEMSMLEEELVSMVRSGMKREEA